MRILIVEDEFTSRAILLKLLAKYGETEVAVDGVEALNAFQVAHEASRPYDLITLDISMPRMDGDELLSQIRKREEALGIGNEKAVKVIMTTGHKDPKALLRAYKDGCEAYLVKPIDPEKLAAELRHLGWS